MLRKPRFLFLACAVVLASSAWGAEPTAGFTALFNGRDLAGWRGRPHFDPAKEAEGTPEERAQRQADWNADMAAHWKVENGVIVSDGNARAASAALRIRSRSRPATSMASDAGGREYPSGDA